jgi:hypothetical protein
MAGLIGVFLVMATGCLFMACPQDAEDTIANKSGLVAKITEAEANRDSVEVSVTGDGNDVEIGFQWVTVVTKDWYNVAIASAKKVQYDGGATQGQVNQAIAVIDAATAVFNPLKKDGLNPNYNTRTLRLAIYNADNLLADTQVSSRNNGIEYPAATYWVIAAQKTTYQNAIADARAVVGDTGKNQSDLDAATAVLESATVVFNTERQPGIKPDKTALAAAITEAKTNRDSVYTASNAGDIIAGQKWVTTTENDTFNTAITGAELVNNADQYDASVLQAQVDAQVSSLAAATTAFNSAKKDGARTVGSVNAPTVVTAKIIAAGIGTGDAFTASLALSKTQVLVTFDEEVAVPEGGDPAAGWSITGSLSATSVTNCRVDAAIPVNQNTLILTLNGKPSIDEINGMTLSYDSSQGSVKHRFNSAVSANNATNQAIEVTGFTSTLDTRPTLTGVTIDGIKELYWRENAKSGVPTYKAAPSPRGVYARMVYLTFSPDVRIDTEFYYAFTINNLPQGYRINRITKASNGTNSGHGQAADSANLQFASPAIILYLNDTLSNAEVAAITVSYDMTKGNLRDVNDNKVASFTYQPVAVSNYPTDTEIAQNNFRLPHADILDVVMNNTKNAYNAAIYPVPDTKQAADAAVLNNGGANKRPASIYHRFVPDGATHYMLYYRWKWDGPGSDSFFTLPYRDDAALKAKLDDDDGFSFEAVFCNNSTGVAMGNSSAKLKKGDGNFHWVVTIDGQEETVSTQFTGSTLKTQWNACHIVGTWNKMAKTLSLYADGQLVDTKTVTGAGVFTQPPANGQWFSFNGEASDTVFETAISNPNGGGELVLGRIYGWALNAQDAAGLYEDVQRGTLATYDGNSVTSPDWP